MTKRNEIWDKKRLEYQQNLAKAREAFLEAYYHKDFNKGRPSNTDLLCVLIIQNIEIKSLLQTIVNKGGN